MTTARHDYRGIATVARRHEAEAAVVALVAMHNWLSNRRLPAAVYVPANLTVAGAVLAVARWAGVSWSDLGLGRGHVAAGLPAAGGVAAAILAVVSAAAVAVPTRGLFADDRVLSLTPRTAAYQALVRIPVGTALCEELVFRGALLGLSLRRRSWPASVAWTSALFGAWHVLPTIDTLPKNPLGRTALAGGWQRRAVAGSVTATAAAGAGFALLRRRTGSVAPAVVAHATLNVAAFLAARHAPALRAHRASCSALTDLRRRSVLPGPRRATLSERLR